MFQLLIATLLGSALGFQRELHQKAAGSRTYGLVALGACLFTILSREGFAGGAFDPSRIASQIVVGIGFLGAGLIFMHERRVEGLTTAAGLWVTAAIGMAVGVERYDVAVVATVLAFLLFLLVGLRIEERIRKTETPTREP